MEKSLSLQHVHIRHGAYLPHWTLEGATYSVVFRLADSLPESIVESWRRERDQLQADSELDALRRQRLTDVIERALDDGHGACWVQRPEIASLVAGALRHFDGKRYELFAWCVMPNHVHAIVRPLAPYSLSKILQTWKGYTAHAANQLLARTGTFWQREAYDHLIRDAAELHHSIQYVLKNPNKGGLSDWPWVWANQPR
jgi:REP element-mobilizing transposase RayT